MHTFYMSVRYVIASFRKNIKVTSVKEQAITERELVFNAEIPTEQAAPILNINIDFDLLSRRLK